MRDRDNDLYPENYVVLSIFFSPRFLVVCLVTWKRIVFHRYMKSEFQSEVVYELREKGESCAKTIQTMEIDSRETCTTKHH